MARSTVVLLLLTLPATKVTAQRTADRQQLAPEATFSEPFSAVSGLRELRDGRLIVADRLEQAVRLVDMVSGASQDLGRVGGGPGEHQTPGGLIPLPGDSTLLVDFGNLRLTVIGPTGATERSTPMMRADGLFLNPAGADAQGRLYFEMTDFGGRRGAGDGIPLPDSAAIVRWDQRSDRIDTVGHTRLPQRGPARTMRSAGGGTLRLAGVHPGPFAPRDAWVVAPDGRVAIVSATEYRVTWLDEDGHVTVGPGVAYDPVRITRKDKDAWVDQQTHRRVTVLTGASGGQTMTLPRPDVDDVSWPDYKPPFRAGAVWIATEGELWVEREVAFGDALLFDVFNGSGRRVRQVGLPAGRRVVGFGEGTVYAVRTDADGLQWLERYRR